MVYGGGILRRYMDEVYGDATQRGILNTNLHIGNSFVNMFAKSGALHEAKKVFDELPQRDVVSWNALITSYVQHGNAKKAVSCFERIQNESCSRDVVTYAMILKAYCSKQFFNKGIKLHAEIVAQDLQGKNSMVANGLVDMYVKCGALGIAQKTFGELAFRDVVSWTALMGGYVHNGHSGNALDFFKQMQGEGLCPDPVAFACILKACGSVKDLNTGKRVHVAITTESLLAKDVVLVTALVDMYAKCGALAKAKQILDELALRNVSSWNALIAGYLQQGYTNEAIKLFERMKSVGVTAGPVTFSCILKACGSEKAKKKGQEIVAMIMGQRLLEDNVSLNNALVDMYVKFNELATAHKVFDDLPIHDIVSWNVLLSGYVQYECHHEALDCFEQMQYEGLIPDAVTYASILKACGNIRAIEKGKEIHAEIIRNGCIGKNVILNTALLDMYAKCEMLTNAEDIFNKLTKKNAVSWNALISGYSQYGCNHEVLKCFDQMQQDGFSPDSVTFTCVLKACGSTGMDVEGQQLHDQIAREGLLDRNPVIGNALVDMYTKCGKLEKAQHVFDELPVRCSSVWNSLITGYAQYGHAEQALSYFEQMQHEGVSPDLVTFTCVVNACRSIGATQKGAEIHAEIVRGNMLEKHHALGNALVDMYAKCGEVTSAHNVFGEIPIQTIISWTSIITGYAQLGEHDIVFELFSMMTNDGVAPDVVTFTVVLKACSSSGLCEKGQMYFDIMSMSYGLMPSYELHACMVGLFGFSGHFDRAITTVKKMPFCEYTPMWSALLSACKKWGNVKVGKFAFDSVIQVSKTAAGATEKALYI